MSDRVAPREPEGEGLMATKTIYRVQGANYLVWADQVARCMYATPIGNTADLRKIREGGYLTQELSIRKAIAGTYGLKSFRKEVAK